MEIAMEMAKSRLLTGGAESKAASVIQESRFKASSCGGFIAGYLNKPDYWKYHVIEIHKFLKKEFYIIFLIKDKILSIAHQNIF